MRTRLFVTIAFVAGVYAGYAMSLATSAQEPDRSLAKGYGRASSSLRLTQAEWFRLTLPGTPERTIQVIPPGRMFVLTDVMFTPQQSVREDVVVNIGLARADQPPRGLFQVKIGPNDSHDIHLCSGYEVPEGYGLVAYTGASAQPEQFVSIAVTGYITRR